MAKSALFAAQVLRRDPIADRREDEVEDFLRFVSTKVSESVTDRALSTNAPSSSIAPKREA